VGHAGRKPIQPQYLTWINRDAAADDAIFTCDVGMPTVWGARCLKMNGKRRLLGSFKSRLDGECDAAGDRRAGGLSRPPGNLTLR
jgi:hypothetical protein